MAYQRQARSSAGPLRSASTVAGRPAYPREDPYAKELPPRSLLSAGAARDQYRPAATAAYRDPDPYRGLSKADPYTPVAVRDPYDDAQRPPARDTYPRSKPVPAKVPGGNRDHWQKEFEDMEADYFLTTGSLPPPRTHSPEPSHRTLPHPSSQVAGKEKYDPFENSKGKGLLGPIPAYASSRPSDEYDREPSRTMPSGPNKQRAEAGMYFERKASSAPDRDYHYDTELTNKADYDKSTHKSRFDAENDHNRHYDERRHNNNKLYDYSPAHYQDRKPEVKKSILKRPANEPNMQPAKKTAASNVGEIDANEIAEFKRWKEEKAKQEQQRSSQWGSSNTSNQFSKTMDDYSGGCKVSQSISCCQC